MIKQTLYQIHVETRAGHILPIGPKAPREFVETMIIAINAKIAEGKEREWSNPHIVEVTPVLN